MTPEEEDFERAVAVLLRAAHRIAEDKDVCLLCLIYGAATIANEAEVRGDAKHWGEEHVSQAVH